MDNNIPTDLNIEKKDRKGLYQSITIHDIPLDTITNYLPNEFFNSDVFINWLNLNDQLNHTLTTRNQINNIDYNQILIELLLKKYNNNYDLKIDTLYDYRKKYIEYYSSRQLLIPLLKNEEYEIIPNTRVSPINSFRIVKLVDGQLVTDIKKNNKDQKNEIFQNKYNDIQKLFEESNNYMINIKKYLTSTYTSLNDAKKKEFESIIRVGMQDTTTYFDRDEIDFTFDMIKVLDKLFSNFDSLDFLFYISLFKYNGFIRLDYSDAIIEKYQIQFLLKKKYYSSLDLNDHSDNTNSNYFNISLGSLDKFIQDHDILNDNYSIV